MNTKDQYFFTSESVTEGHPDKIADQISDAVLDAHLKVDPHARVACETLLTTGLIVVAGEITSKNSQVNYQKIARETVLNIGYDHSEKGFDAHTCGVIVTVGQQSPDISMGVDEANDKEQGAGDQGIMFGYAVNESKEFMPLTIELSHRLAERLSFVRKNQIAPLLRPDGKTQVTAQYEQGKIKRIDSIVISTQHAEEMTLSQVKEVVMETVVAPVIPKELIDSQTKYYINPTGRFVIGGPMGDCGLTGRKIIVDTYGGHGAHGGGAFSGKDPSKVDRSAAYAARYLAKNIVAAGVAEKALVQISYAIGVARPLSIFVNTFGTGKVSDEKIASSLNQIMDLRPKSIIERLQLKRPIFSRTAAYGHFGRTSQNDGGFSWEKCDLINEVKSILFS
ncbi:MAG: methionine adenosyltransferase [Bacteriovoracaceae bacterium]|nr:methionine adenosyltransferase [Bacteriovoracaceae bacterium]